MPDLTSLPQVLWNALQSAGGALPLAMAVTILASVTKALDISIAAVFAGIAYAGAAIITSLPPWIAPIGLVCCVLLGVTLSATYARRVFLEYFYDERRLGAGGGNPERVFIGSIAIYLVVEAFIRLIAGNAARSVPPIDIGRFGLLHVQGSLFVFVLVLGCILTCGIVAVLLRRTTFGVWLRAAADDGQLAQTFGLDTKRLIGQVFMLSAGLCAVAALFRLLTSDVTPTMALPTVLWAIAAAVVGGLGSIPGAFVGCCVLAVAEHVSGWAFGAEWRASIVLAVVIGFLLLRPTGLLGRQRPVFSA